ncbi:MAG TPA: hypothetical protein VFN31_03405 [Candidatus Saccharimonadales bacterium]|nr:hypothetical protein [Candidatus Saccharimonadales bacterium]
MSEIERLNSYYPFDEDVLHIVSDVAEAQRNSDWQTIAGKLPEPQIFIPENGNPIQVLDISPKDYETTQVYNLPMGCGLDASMTMRVATLASTQPTKRVIAIGNPGGPGANYGSLSREDRQALSKGNMRPVIEPMFQYLNSQKLSEAVQVGYSYGADKAAAAAFYAANYDQVVPKAIFMEPASVVPRSIVDLGLAFKASADGLDEYIEATASPAYLEARKLAEKSGHGFAGYAGGLMRLSNIAIAKSLCYPSFWPHVSGALDQNENMKADLVWGTKSTISPDKSMRHQLRQPNKFYDHLQRVRTLVIEGGKHAMGDDIFLLSALVLQCAKD